jgi:cyclase
MLREVAPGAWAWLQLPGTWGESNAGLVAAGDASLLVDTLWDQRRTAQMLAAMTEVTRAAPIAVAVNTHADGDHWWGNAELGDDVRIVTSRAALEAMRDETTPQQLARMRRLAGVAARLPIALPRYTAAMLSPFAHGEVRLRLPGDAFDGRREELGCELIDVGATHTAADLVVHAREPEVVFAGDVLFHGVTPIMWHGPVERWIAALDLLLGLGAEVFVPGHGELMGRADVEAFRGYWTWLAGAVERAGEADAPAATRAVMADPGFAPYRDWIAPERTLISVTTMLRGAPLPARQPDRRPVFNQVARLAAEL